MKQDTDLGIGIQHLNQGALITRGLDWPSGERPILAVHPDGFFIPSKGLGGLKGYKNTMEAVDAMVWYKQNYTQQALLEGSEIRTGIALDTKARKLDLDRDEWGVYKDRVALWEKVTTLELSPDRSTNLDLMRRLVAFWVLEEGIK